MWVIATHNEIEPQKIFVFCDGAASWTNANAMPEKEFLEIEPQNILEKEYLKIIQVFRIQILKILGK